MPIPFKRKKKSTIYYILVNNKYESYFNPNMDFNQFIYSNYDLILPTSCIYLGFYHLSQCSIRF